MARLVTRPQRFTPEEWKLASQVKHKNTERDRAVAERLILECDRLDTEGRGTVDRTLADVNKKLDQRLDHIKNWKGELEVKRSELEKEVDATQTYLLRLEKRLESLQDNLHIAQTTLANREKRYDIDLVHDDVQKDLIMEVSAIQGAISLLTRTIEQTKEQLRLMRKARYLLDRDLKDKFTAQSIDEHAIDLNLTSPNLYLKEGVSKVNPRSVSEPFWEEYSDENIKSAETQRLNAVQLRNMIDGILKKLVADVRQAVEKTRRSFDRRIFESKQAKQKLEEQLRDVHLLIDQIEESIKNTEKAIRDKEQYLKLAHTRLDIRHQRPNVELVYDAPQKRLIEEIKEIEREIQRLQERLDESHVRLRNLDRDKLILEKDIETKTNTIFVDEVECQESLRKSISVEDW